MVVMFVNHPGIMLLLMNFVLPDCCVCSVMLKLKLHIKDRFSFKTTSAWSLGCLNRGVVLGVGFGWFG